MVFPVVMYGCESWAIKKAQQQRTDAFKLCWGRLLRVPWTARRSNQLILKEINPEYSLEGLTLKLKLQYCGHLMQKANSLEKTLMVGKTEGKRVYILEIKPLFQCIVYKYFLSFYGLSFCFIYGFLCYAQAFQFN